MKVIKTKRTLNDKIVFLFGIPILQRIRKVYASRGGVEYVRYTYKFCGKTYYRTHSIVELCNQNAINTNQERLCALETKINVVCDTILAIQQEMAEYNIPLNGTWRFQGEMGEYLANNDIKERLIALCSNLDDKSKATIFKVINRLKNYYLNPGYQPLLTHEEKIEHQRIKSEFYPNIYQVNEGCFSYNGYFLPINHFEVGVFWNTYDLHIFKTLDVIRQKSIIDVGAFIGDSALVLSSFTNNNVYAFEATKGSYDLMLETIRLNNSKKIIPIHKGLGADCYKTIINIDNIEGCSSILMGYEIKCSEEIEIITLDSYVKENSIEVGLIKVDIEGFEQEFLKGAKETIKAQKPALLISIYHNIDDFFEIKPMIESWNLGYTFYIHKPIDHSVSVEMALYAEVL